MSRGAQIHNIISSLSRGEKRQFKVYASKYDKQSKNISSQLFDIMTGLKSWDEKVFKEKIEEAGIEKHIAVHSNNLLEQLLHSLRTKEVNSFELLQINKLIEESVILIERDEFKLALTRIKKAKSIAKRSQRYEKLLEILFKEREVQSRILGNLEYKEYRSEYFAEVKETLKLLDNQVEYFQLVEDIFFVFRTVGHPEKADEKSMYSDILNHPLMQDFSKALSPHAQISYYYAHHVGCLGANDLPGANDMTLKQVMIFEANEFFAKANISTYIYILNNLAITQAQLDDPNDSLKTIEKLRSIPERYSINSKFIRQQIFELSYNEEIDFFLMRNRLDEIKEIVIIVEREISRMGEQGVSLNPFLNLAIRLAIYYFRMGNIKKSHKWTKDILNHEGSRSSIHNTTFAVLLDLILHYQSGDKEYLQYRLNNVRKLFQNTKQLNAANELFLSTLKQLIRTTEPDKVDDILNAYKLEFDQLPGTLTKLFYTHFLAMDQLIESKFAVFEPSKPG